MRIARVALALLGPGVAALAAHTGWLAAPRPWQEATGWRGLPDTPGPVARFDVGGAGALRLRWLGHSGFLLEWGGARLLLDPNLSPRCTVARRVLQPVPGPAALGAIDAALISHAHLDHLDLPTLRGVPRLGSVLLPAGAERHAACLARRGIRVVGLRPDETRRFGALEVIAVPARHGGSRHHPLRGAEGALGWIVRHQGETIYFAGDTAADLDFAALRAAWHPRLAILPIGAYAPRLPMRWVHLSPEEAAAAARSLGVEVVVPCHFGTFALALDRPARALPRFARAARRQGVRWAMPALFDEAGERGR